MSGNNLTPPRPQPQGRKNLSGSLRAIPTQVSLEVKSHFPPGGGEVGGRNTKEKLLESPYTTKAVFAFSVTLQTSFKVDEPRETQGDTGSLSKVSCLKNERTYLSLSGLCKFQNWVKLMFFAREIQTTQKTWFANNKSKIGNK